MDEIDVDKLSAELTEFMKDYRVENPNWEPLEKVMPLKWCSGFMWMGQTNGIHLYKHGFTRHYLNLDEQGNAYRYLGTKDRYVPMDLDDAIAMVFEGLETIRVSRSTPYDDEAVRRKHEALAEVGWTTINVSPEGVTLTKPTSDADGGSKEPTPNSNHSKPQPRRAERSRRREGS
jgi:hypothetical protein